jgi:hypothetical protein
VDILEHEKPALWIVGNDRLHIVGLFNWDEKNPTTIACDPARMGLDTTKKYDVFDFWANRYLGTVSGTWNETLEGAGCRVLALRETATHPQLLSTSRHITQGLIDVKSESWDPAARILSGTSAMVDSDPYELRLVCPDALSPTNISVNENDGTCSGFTREGNLVRVTITPKKTGAVDWALTFNLK